MFGNSLVAIWHLFTRRKYKNLSPFSRGRWAPAGLLQAANFRNKWNRRPQIGDNSLISSFLSVLLACLSYWKPILGHSLTSLLVYFQCSGHYLIPQFSFSQFYYYIQIETQGWSFKLLVVGLLWCQQYWKNGIMLSLHCFLDNEVVILLHTSYKSWTECWFWWWWR